MFPKSGVNEAPMEDPGAPLANWGPGQKPMGP